MSSTKGSASTSSRARPPRRPSLFRNERPAPIRRVLLAIACALAAGAPAHAARRFVRVAGGAYTVSVDSQGRYAYVANDTTVQVLDLATRSLASVHQTTGISDAGPVGPGDAFLPLYGFSSAGVLDIRRGLVRTLIDESAPRSSAYLAAVVAHDHLYAASFNGRVVQAVPLDSATPAMIDPYPDLEPNEHGVAGPCELVASPDESQLLLGDEFNAAIHVIRTADATVTATLPVGFPPCRLFFKDATTAVAVYGGQAAWADSTGEWALVDLTTPNAPIRPRRIRGLRQLQAAAVDPAGRLLVVLNGGEPQEGPGTSVRPRVGIASLATGKVLKRVSLPTADGFAAAVAITPDARTILVGTTRGVRFIRLKRR